MFELAFNFPNINPEIFGFEIFGKYIALRWYAVAYMAGIYLGWVILMRIVKRHSYPYKNITGEIVDDFLTYCILGVIIGGRIFGTLVYNFSYYKDHLLEVIIPPYAGMSFHGGFLGVIIAVILVARKHKVSVLAFGDLMALVAPIGLGFGRLANFINAELWGKPTDISWGVIFPGDAAQNCGQAMGELCARHPSQIYEMLLEGILLGTIIWLLYARGGLKNKGLLSGVFFLGYGLARMFVELFRNPDQQFLATDPSGFAVRFGEFGLSMGQLLSLPMVFIGIAFILYSRKSNVA